MNAQRFIPAALLATIIFARTPMLVAQDEPDDRLPPEQRHVVAGLIQRGMPELVEEALSGAPTMHRVHIARAFVVAAAEEESADRREQLLSRAAEEYRRVIALAKDRAWYHGDLRRLDVAQWRVEFGDLILRFWTAHDLDQLEITSGIGFDSARLRQRLIEARDAYIHAARTLDDLDVELRTDEERFLILGIAERITELIAGLRMNLAWADLYLGMTVPPGEPQHAQLVDEALLTFDTLSRAAADEERKYRALLGAGIALRESARYDEAVSALQRVIHSTASTAIIVRAEFEMARAYLRAAQYDDARRWLDRLAGRSLNRLGSGDRTTEFYVHLAPLIHAYTYMHQAAAKDTDPSRKAEFEETARKELVALAARGGSWQRLAQMYLDALAGRKRSIDQLTPVELLLAAGQAMKDLDYSSAEKAWRLLLSRPDDAGKHHEARLNLGVCLFQTRRTREAAEIFLDESRRDAPPDLRSRAGAYAYRCWRQLAAETKSSEDYLKLAEAAQLLADRQPDHPEAAEARWIAALALDEGGDYRRAASAYSTIRPAAETYWQARRNIARCRQKLFESLPPGASDDRRTDYARRAVDEWTRFANDLAALDKSTVRGRNPKPAGTSTAPTTAPADSQRVEWIADARLAACALWLGDDLRQYRTALDVLAQLPLNARVLGMRIRCLQALGEIQEANQVLEDYLKDHRTDELGSVLVTLAAEMESEVKRFQRAGRSRDAKRLADETLPTIRHLLEWIESRPEHARHVAVVRFSLASMYVQAGRFDDAMREIEWLMNRHPANGSYLLAAARLREKMADAALASDREVLFDKAEALWEKLLLDGRLRENAPAEYWEARTHWLRHQLRHGKAAEVVRGIETEKAWRPDLGGPPWQGQLLQLAEEARSQVDASIPAPEEPGPLQGTSTP